MISYSLDLILREDSKYAIRIDMQGLELHLLKIASPCMLLKIGLSDSIFCKELGYMLGIIIWTLELNLLKIDSAYMSPKKSVIGLKIMQRPILYAQTYMQVSSHCLLKSRAPAKNRNLSQIHWKLC
jgi:hypothetical protein